LQDFLELAVSAAAAALHSAQAQLQQTLAGETRQQRAQDAVSLQQASLAVRTARTSLADARQAAAQHTKALATSVAQAEAQLAADQDQLQTDLAQLASDQPKLADAHARGDAAAVQQATQAVTTDQSKLAQDQAKQQSDQVANQAHLHSVLGLSLNPGSVALTTVLGLAVLAAVTLTAIRGADVSARFQRPLIIFEYLVLIGFCGYAIIVGTHPIALSWFNPASLPSAKVFATGLVVSVYIFWGWDSAFSVTEETRSPRDAARAGYGSLWLMLGMFLLAAIGFERLFSLDQMTQNASALLPYLGTELARQPLAALPLLALLFSSIASLQAGVLPTARQTLAMGRAGTLGPIWTRLHPRFATPAVGTMILTSIAALLAVLGIGIGTLSQFISAAATSVGMLVSLYYGLAGLTCAIRFRGQIRHGVVAALRAVILPAISAVVLLFLGGYLAYSDWTSVPGFAPSFPLRSAFATPRGAPARARASCRLRQWGAPPRALRARPPRGAGT